MAKQPDLGSLGERLAPKGAGKASGHRTRAKPAPKASAGRQKKILLAISEQQWSELKQIALDRRQTLKGVCLDAFDLVIAKHGKRD